MRLLEPIVPDARAPLARAHPLAKLAAGSCVLVAVFVTVDVVTPSLALAALVAALPLSGVAPRALATRIAPLLLSVAGLALFNGLLGGGGIAGGIAVALRVSAIALAGLLALATTDPTDLADALVEHLHAPARFAIGTLAALRLAPIFSREWEIIGLARRARGIDDASSSRAILRGFAERTFGLLVGAIRRAGRLAVAMDARGFDLGVPRSLARPRPLRAGDWMWVMAGIVVAAASSAASLAAGTWRFVFGAPF